MCLYLAILSGIESVLDCCCLCISLLELEIQLSRAGFGSYEHIKQLQVYVSITCMWSSLYFVGCPFVYPMLWGEICWRSPLKHSVSNLKDHFTGFVQESFEIWNPLHLKFAKLWIMKDYDAFEFNSKDRVMLVLSKALIKKNNSRLQYRVHVLYWRSGNYLYLTRMNFMYVIS